MTTVDEKMNSMAPGEQGHCCKIESELIDSKNCQRGKQVKGSHWELRGNQQSSMEHGQLMAGQAHLR